MKYDVFTVADLCVDIIVGNHAVPEFGQKEKLVDYCRITLGGSCSIFACQAAKLGLKVAVAGVVGDDNLGDFIIKELRKVGVDTSYVKVRKDVETGAGLAICNGKDRSILTFMGSIDAVNSHNIDFSELPEARHLHVSNYFLMRSLKPHIMSLIDQYKHAGATVSVDTNWDPEEKWELDLQELLGKTDIFFPNSNELLHLAKVADGQEAMEKITELVPTLVIKKGSSGAMIRCGGQTLEMDAVEPYAGYVYVDSVGAGDSFDAGFVYGRLKGFSDEKALLIANICGACNTAQVGGVQGQPTAKELERYLTAQPGKE